MVVLHGIRNDRDSLIKVLIKKCIKSCSEMLFIGTCIQENLYNNSCINNSLPMYFMKQHFIYNKMTCMQFLCGVICIFWEVSESIHMRCQRYFSYIFSFHFSNTEYSLHIYWPMINGYPLCNICVASIADFSAVSIKSLLSFPSQGSDSCILIFFWRNKFDL